MWDKQGSYLKTWHCVLWKPSDISWKETRVIPSPLRRTHTERRLACRLVGFLVSVLTGLFMSVNWWNQALSLHLYELCLYLDFLLWQLPSSIEIHFSQSFVANMILFSSPIIWNMTHWKEKINLCAMTGIHWHCNEISTKPAQNNFMYQQSRSWLLYSTIQ